jgi:hypothetical protein
MSQKRRPLRTSAVAGEPAARHLGLARTSSLDAAVFVAALALRLDDPALVVALTLAVRGGRLILDI